MTCEQIILNWWPNLVPQTASSQREGSQRESCSSNCWPTSINPVV